MIAVAEEKSELENFLRETYKGNAPARFLQVLRRVQGYECSEGAKRVADALTKDSVIALHRNPVKFNQAESYLAGAGYYAGRLSYSQDENSGDEIGQEK